MLGIHVAIGLPDSVAVAMAVELTDVVVGTFGSIGVLLACGVAWATVVARVGVASLLAVGSGLMLQNPQAINPIKRQSSDPPTSARWRNRV